MSEQQRKKLETESMALQKLQKEYATLVESRQKLDSQLQENELVDKEFKLMKDSARVYKLTGPVLLPQDKAEAMANVEKRIEFIKGEIKRVDLRVEQLAKEQEKKSVEIFKLQMEIQGVNKK
ncbi:Prefoldin subunit 6 [Dipsacomyces acuminosporus]|nr:Prefoldin subunit 6 [Dipsacomyces acuminosporus]